MVHLISWVHGSTSHLLTPVHVWVSLRDIEIDHPTIVHNHRILQGLLKSLLLLHELWLFYWACRFSLKLFHLVTIGFVNEGLDCVELARASGGNTNVCQSRTHNLMLLSASIILERSLLLLLMLMLPRRIIGVVVVLHFLLRREWLARSSHRRICSVVVQVARTACGLLQVVHCVTTCIHLDLLTKNVREHLWFNLNLNLQTIKQAKQFVIFAS